VQTFSSLGFQTSSTIEEHLTIGISSTTHIRPTSCHRHQVPTSRKANMYVQQAKFANFGGRSSFNLAFFGVDCWMHTKCRISGFWKYFVRRGAYARMYYNSDPGAYRNGPKFGPNSDPMSTETGQNFEQVRSCLRTEWPSRYRTPIQSIRLRWVEIFSVLAPRAQPLRSSTPYSLSGCSPDRTNSWSSEASRLRSERTYWILEAPFHPLLPCLQATLA